MVRASDVTRLIGKSGSGDMSFAQPQVVIALTYAYRALSGREHLALRNQIEAAVLRYMSNVDGIEKALDKDGAFAANWYLQATAAVRATRWSCLSSTCKNLKANEEIEGKAVNLCMRAIEKSNVSITEQACAAHGLLAVNQFDYERYDVLLEQWARYQYEWDAESHGGFRYRVDEAWYRTDVTSHVVEVCLAVYWRRGDRNT
jgi:hypothetical protein